MLEEFSPSKPGLLSIPKNSTDLSLLELINVMNEYKAEEAYACRDGQLLNALAEINVEMQKYKRHPGDCRELHKNISKIGLSHKLIDDNKH